MKKIVYTVLLAIIFITFFNGVADKGPSRRKFKVLESGEENLIKPEAAPTVNRLQEISKNKHFTEWVNWWQRCIPGFSLDKMEDLGQFPVDNEPTDFVMTDKTKKGPGGIFYLNAPDGKKYINPYWGRLVYRWKDNDWWPYFESGCGAELYEPGQKKSSIVLKCYTNDGLEGAFWVDRDRVAIMGYDSVTRQMSVECETTESCVAPSVWILDLKNAVFSQYRGSVVKRNACNLDGYLKMTMTKFFGK